MNRGDLVIVDLRAVSPHAGVRPALVVQNDRDNARMSNTIVAQVTTNTRRAAEASQLLIDPGHIDWAASGLRHSSVVNCSTIYTIEQSDVVRIIGSLSVGTMQQIDRCLKDVLGIP